MQESESIQKKLLKSLNYDNFPTFVEAKIRSLEVKKEHLTTCPPWCDDRCEVYRENKIINISQTEMYIDDKLWMIWDEKTCGTAYELFSHYYLAKGHTICSGLGLGIRESWLLSKPGVDKITVIENEKEVIEYHEYNKSPFLKEIEVIHGDIREYTGKCDTLLLDHYSGTDRASKVLEDVYNIQKNIEHDVLWFWPLECIIDKAYFKYGTTNSYGPNPRSHRKAEIYDFFLKIKRSHNLHTIPDLSPEIISFFICMYYQDMSSIKRTYQSKNLMYEITDAPK